MRAIVIDPYERRVFEVETDGSLLSMYKLLSTPEHPVDCICHVTLIQRQEFCWLDDTGFLTPDRAVFYFNTPAGRDQPLCGRGLILGCDEEGGNQSTVFPLKMIQEGIIWTDKVSSGDFTEPTERTEGDMFVIEGGKPILKDRDDGKA